MDARGARRSPLSNDYRARTTLQALRGIQTNPQPRMLRLKAPVAEDDETSEPVEAGQSDMMETTDTGQSDMMDTTDTGNQSAIEDEDTSGAPPMSAQVGPGSDPSMGSVKDSTPVSVPSLDSPLITTQIDPVVRPRQYWNRLRRARAATIRPPSPDSSPGNVQRNQQFANVFTTMEDRANNTLEGSHINKDINDNYSLGESGTKIDTPVNSPPMSTQIQPESDIAASEEEPGWLQQAGQLMDSNTGEHDGDEGTADKTDSFADTHTFLTRAEETLNNNFSLAMKDNKIDIDWREPPENEALQSTPSAAPPVDGIRKRQASFRIKNKEQIVGGRKRNPGNINFESTSTDGNN